MDVRLAAALFRLNALRPEQLGDVGVALISAGHDTPAVVELAGLDHSATWREVGDVFERALREVHIEVPSERDAAYLVAVLAAEDIVSGRLTPYEGAARIAYLAYHAASQSEDLSPFYYWADEWEDHPEFRVECENNISAEAEVFLSNHRARST